MKNNAQILVEQGGKRNPFSDEKPYEETHMLHHRSWALPIDIIPVITKAFVIGDGTWDATRATNVIRFLKTADPNQFKIEKNNTLRGDITHLYILRAQAKGGRTVALPEWVVGVYVPTTEWFDSQITDWEIHKGVSSLEEEPVNLSAVKPYDYKDCINQGAFRKLGTAKLKMRNKEPRLEMTKNLGRMVRSYATSGY